MASLAERKNKILELVAEYTTESHKCSDFVPGVTPVPPSGKVFGPEEVRMLVDSALEFWLTAGRFNDEFEQKLSKHLSGRHVLTANSGSSANLLAVAALTSPQLGDRALKPGDEVITVAAGFPTTVNPLLQYGLIPVFVDIELPTYSVNITRLADAITERTKAIFLAHTLGNPFSLDQVTSLVKEHKLWLIEDCCDALGSLYRSMPVGTFGDIGTVSFYPAHQITMGEGGAIFTGSGKLRRIIQSFRDWGRDCYCEPGADNTCGRRFEYQLGDLPFGYDHKYIYTHAGYNLKITDMQAAIGVAQLDRLPGFIEQRKRNFEYLYSKLVDLQDFIVLPAATVNSEPSWFGFPITLRATQNTNRTTLLKYLDERKVGVRLLFGGNLVKQPYMKEHCFRVQGDLMVTDDVMNNGFWIGVYPGITEEMLDYMATVIRNFFNGIKVG